VELRLRVAGTQRLPIRSLDSLRYEIARRGPKRDQWLPAQVTVTVDGGRSVAPAPGDRAPLAFVLLYRFPRSQRYTWDVYAVRVRAGRANVAPPEWVASWSTRDDRPLAQSNRTLNLHLLVEAMIRGITEEVILSEHYLRLGRES
jgi:hypothetical protein